MARILLLETSTAVLSVALAEDGTIVARRRCEEPRMQASLTAPLVKEVLEEARLGVRDCDAICVSKGPGSYTGLRVGVSTAKGLAFGAGLPLIAIGTLDVLAAGARQQLCAEGDEGRADGQIGFSGTAPKNNLTGSVEQKLSSNGLIVPMIDARRMEVYTAVFSPEGKQLTPVEAKIIDAQSFAEELAAGPVLFTGDGALKCRGVLSHPNARFQEAWPEAEAMAGLAQKAWEQKRFEDLAYFEPYYLKDFVATVSRKNLF